MSLKKDKKKTIIAVTSAILLMGGFMSYIVYDTKEKKMEQAINNGMHLTFVKKGKQTIEYGKPIRAKDLIQSYKGDLEVPEFDTKTLGVQNLRYVLTFDGVEKDYEKTIVIRDTQKPILKAKKGTEFHLKKGDKMPFTEKDFEAKDPVDGVLKVNFENPVDVDKVGTYQVLVWAKDKNHNRSTMTVKVIVDEDKEEKQLNYALGNELDSFKKVNERILSIRNRDIYIDQEIEKDIRNKYVHQFNLCPQFLLDSVDTFQILTDANFRKVTPQEGTLVGYTKGEDGKITVFFNENIVEDVVLHECAHAFAFRHGIADNEEFKTIFDKEKEKYGENAAVNIHEFFAHTFTSYLIEGYESLAKNCPETAAFYKEFEL